jgi:hypothetical protein
MPGHNIIKNEITSFTTKEKKTNQNKAPRASNWS